MRWKDYCNKILTTIDCEAFYTDELQRRNIQYSRRGIELKCACPFPERHATGVDSSPSFTVNLDKGVYWCNACGSKGNVMTFYREMYHVSREDAWYALGDALGIERPDTKDSRLGIDPGLPAQYCLALKNLQGPIKKVLHERRGLTDAILYAFCIGWDGERVTIPIYDENNDLVNIRRYMWNSVDDNFKMINYTDEVNNVYGENRIYGIEHLYNDTLQEVLWCEGEWDRLVAEQWGIPACTGTSGASNINAHWYDLLRQKKRVYVAFDNDATGNAATQEFIRNLSKDTEILALQWSTAYPNKCDITDLFVTYHLTREAFLGMFKHVTDNETIPLISLVNSTLAKYTDKRMSVPALVAGKAMTPYILPSMITAKCDYFDAEKKGCGSCIFSIRSSVTRAFTSKDADLLMLVDCPQDKQESILKKLLGISVKCPCPTIDKERYMNLELVQLVPKADTSFGFGSGTDYCTRTAYTLTTDVQSNKRYLLTGYMHAHPNTQQATHIFDTCVPEKNLADDFQVTPELLEDLKIFQPKEGQSVADKMAEIHADLERNVTYVWKRRDVGYATDLVYHSVLNFTFQEQPVKRGWCECLIIGDSGQAKTTLVERLMQHYKLGELLSGESTRRTGLVYTLKQMGDAWMLNWGAMPLNDGGLLAIDELSGMSTDDLAKMSDVRSSGIAKANGVVTGETLARTRMIFISNPRSGRQLKAEPYGVSAILRLFGAAEDVRRLDFAIGVASGEVETELVNVAVSTMPEIEHVYTSELCTFRVLWAWSRKAENVKFTDAATKKILEYANLMGKKYSARIPLVEAADQRLKLARLSVSVACCMFSTENGQDVIIKPEHVEFVYTYLNRIYDSRALNYDKFSVDDFESNDTTSDALQSLRQKFIALPFASQPLDAIVRALYQLNQRSTRNTISDATGLDPDELRLLLPFMLNNSIIEVASDGNAYYKTTVGREFLESLLLDPPTETEIVEARKARLKGSEV